jgi:hypothetical protein
MVGAAAAVGGPAALWSRRGGGTRLVDLAAATKPAGSDLGAVEHIVFLMMENRSYDHYVGAYPKGRGFDDHPKKSLGVFAQNYPGWCGRCITPLMSWAKTALFLMYDENDGWFDHVPPPPAPASALFTGKYDTTVPPLPAPILAAPTLTGSCSLQSQDTETGGAAPNVPTNQMMPNQQGGTEPPPKKYFPSGDHPVTDDEARTTLGPSEPRPVTTKSAYNRLAAARSWGVRRGWGP